MAIENKGLKIPSIDDLFTSQEEREEAALKKIYEIPLAEIDPFPDHPFIVRDDEDILQYFGILFAFYLIINHSFLIKERN